MRQTRDGDNPCGITRSQVPDSGKTFWIESLIWSLFHKLEPIMDPDLGAHLRESFY